jgi:hypothetical protein
MLYALIIAVIVQMNYHVSSTLSMLGVVCCWKGFWALLDDFFPNTITAHAITALVGCIILSYLGTFSSLAGMPPPPPSESSTAKGQSSSSSPSSGSTGGGRKKDQ